MAIDPEYSPATAAAPLDAAATSSGDGSSAESPTDSVPHPGPWPVFRDLTKFRLSLLVLWTTLTGALLGSHVAGGGIDLPRLAWTLLGTAMSAGGAAALNQVLEVRRDLAMRRTAGRPLPAGHVSPFSAWMIAGILAAAGVGMLACLVNAPSAWLAATTIGLYGFVYTPLKPLTTLNTFVGAVVGAIPPMIGWVAVTGHLDPGAWSLFALLFIWQIPHFLALAWMYREDYARGGFIMLPARDPDGRLTAQAALAGSLLLVPVALGLVLTAHGGWLFAAGAIAGGLWMSVRAAAFVRDRSDLAARRLFLSSLLYLLVVLSLAVVDPTRLLG